MGQMNHQKKATCTECDDCNRLVRLWKEKCEHATKNKKEKWKLLTLIPHSWKKKRIMQEFQLNEYTYKKLKNLKKQ